MTKSVLEGADLHCLLASKSFVSWNSRFDRRWNCKRT
jgi:hypothetical protein